MRFNLIIIVSVTNSYIKITIALIVAGAAMGLLLGSTKYSFNSLALICFMANRGKFKFNIVSSLIIGIFAVNEVFIYNR